MFKNVRLGAERALKNCSRGRDGVHNNERFARAGKANVNGNGLNGNSVNAK